MNSCWGCTYLSLFCVNSGEANIPRLCLPSPSEDTGVVVASSPELYLDPKLTLLDGKSMGVTSVLATSTMALGS